MEDYSNAGAGLFKNLPARENNQREENTKDAPEAPKKAEKPFKETKTEESTPNDVKPRKNENTKPEDNNLNLNLSIPEKPSYVATTFRFPEPLMKKLEKISEVNEISLNKTVNILLERAVNEMTNTSADE